jgi:hypothetical protein
MVIYKKKKKKKDNCRLRQRDYIRIRVLAIIMRRFIPQVREEKRKQKCVRVRRCKRTSRLTGDDMMDSDAGENNETRTG